jgi:uncharacterized membrane protein YqjE
MKLLEPNGLVDNLYRYVQTQIELTQIEVQERIEAAIKKLVLLFVLGIISAIFLVFVFITLSLFLNHITHSSYWGFLIVTFLLGIITALVFYAVKKPLEKDDIPKPQEAIAEDIEV